MNERNGTYRLNPRLKTGLMAGLVSGLMLLGTGGAAASAGGIPGEIARIKKDVARNAKGVKKNARDIDAHASFLQRHKDEILANQTLIATNHALIFANQEALAVQAQGLEEITHLGQFLLQAVDEVNVRSIDNMHAISSNQQEIQFYAFDLMRTQEDVGDIDQKIIDMTLLLDSAGQTILDLQQRSENLRQYTRATRRWVRAISAAREMEARAAETTFIQSALLNGLGPEELPADYWARWIELARDIVEATRCRLDDEGLYPELERGNADCILTDGSEVVLPEGQEDGVILSSEDSTFAATQVVQHLEIAIENAYTELDLAVSDSTTPECIHYYDTWFNTYRTVLPEGNPQAVADYRACLLTLDHIAEQVHAMKNTTQNVVNNGIKTIVVGGDDGITALDECEQTLFAYGEAIDACAAEEAALAEQWETIEIKGEKEKDKTTDCDLKYFIFGFDGDGCIFTN